MPYTIYDLAKECNVSVATISRVINNSPKVKEDTRKLVLETMEKHNYKPNVFARGMKNVGMNLIGVLVSDIANPFFTDIIKSIESVCHANNYEMILCTTQNDINKEKLKIELLKQKQVDGFILAGSRPVNDPNEEYLKELSKNYPVVLINSFIEGGDKLYSVMVDEKKASIEALEAILKNKTYKKIYLFGDPSWVTTQSKKAGLEYVCSRQNLPYDKSNFVSCEYGYNSGIEGVKAVFSAADKEYPVLIFCASDQIAIGAKKQLTDMKIKIPEQAGLLGYSNTEISSLVTPALSTVDQYMSELGKKAAELFIQINKGNTPEEKRFYSDYKFIQRETT